MRFLAAITLAAVWGCSSAAKPSATTPSTTASTMSPATTAGTRTEVITEITRAERFRPMTGDSAIKAFVPDVLPEESGGVCNVSRPYGPGVTVVIATFPNNDSTARSSLMVTFDSAGHVVRFADRRGRISYRTAPGLTMDQRDSVRRALDATMRSTSINFDYAINQALVMNSGGGKPTVAITGSIRSMENLEKLGPPTKRIQRLRKLCGV